MQNKIPQIFVLLIMLHSQFLLAEKAVVIIGPAGSGKGTQTVKLRDALKWPLVSAANTFREERLAKTVLGEVNDNYKQYKDVASILKLGVIIRRLSQISNRSGIVLDSWPKYPEAVVLAKEAIFKNDQPLVIELVVPKATLLSRVEERVICTDASCNKSYGFGELPNADGTCTNCGRSLYKRPGDNRVHVSERLEKYFRNWPVYNDAFRKNGFTIHHVDGDRSPDVVHNDIMELVREYLE